MSDVEKELKEVVQRAKWLIAKKSPHNSRSVDLGRVYISGYTCEDDVDITLDAELIVSTTIHTRRIWMEEKSHESVMMILRLLRQYMVLDDLSSVVDV